MILISPAIVSGFFYVAFPSPVRFWKTAVSVQQHGLFSPNYQKHTLAIPDPCAFPNSKYGKRYAFKH